MVYGQKIVSVDYTQEGQGVIANLLYHNSTVTTYLFILNTVRTIIGSPYNDNFVGDNNANNIQGGDGNDNIEGKAGADVLDGGVGTDTLTYSSSPAAVIINLATGTVNGGDAVGDTFTNFENLIGSGYADTLTGDGNSNNIQGGAGNDNIEGKAGADVLDGGAGTDTLTYSSSPAAVVINLATGTVNGGDAEGDVISNFENIIGSAFADNLIGNVNSNNIQGGAGNDILQDGGGGNDIFSGGTGADSFIISTAPGTVTITDFNIIDGDKINVSVYNTNFAQLLNSAQDNGYNCDITLGNKTITLINYTKSNMQESWFIFVPTVAPTPAPTAAPTSVPTPDLILGLTVSQLAGIASGVGGSLITLAGFIYESHKYYNPKKLGYDHYYSFAASKIPTCIKATTAAVIQNADDAIDILKVLQNKYTGHATAVLYNELKDATNVVIEACTKVVEFITEDATNGIPNAKEALVSYTGFLEEHTKTLAEYMDKLGNGAELTEVGLTKLPPIGIALSSNKIDLVSLNMSNILFDYEDNGTKSKTSWIGSKDAFLIYDHNDNKQVDYAKELVLTKWSKTAKTDFEALKEIFDSNKDNKFDANDNEFHKFYIWQDKNQDGISQSDELTSLMEAGLKQIDFNTEKNIQDEFFGNYQEMKVAGVIWEDGHQTLAYDLILESSNQV